MVVALHLHLVSVFLISFSSSHTMHILAVAKPHCEQPLKKPFLLSSTLWHSVTLSDCLFHSVSFPLEQLLPTPQDSAQWPYPRKPSRTSPDLSAPIALISYHNYWVCLVVLFLLASPPTFGWDPLVGKIYISLLPSYLAYFLHSTSEEWMDRRVVFYWYLNK